MDAVLVAMSGGLVKPKRGLTALDERYSDAITATPPSTGRSYTKLIPGDLAKQ